METNQVLDTQSNVAFLFSIASVTPAAPANYRAERMRLYLAQNGETGVDTSDARFMLMIAPAPSAPLADKAAFPAVSESVQRQHNARIACATQSVARETPLLAGETVESDLFTFLTAEYNGFPARTVVLQRTTNYGELLYLFQGLTVDTTGQLLFQEPPLLQATPAAPKLATTTLLAITPSSVATSVAKGLASGMLSAVGGAIAGSILDAIFPPGVPSYFDEVYEEITRIIDAQLQQATIDQVNGAINNIKVHISTEYMPAKQTKNLDVLADRQFLFALLQKYETTYLSGPGGMLGTLMSDKYAKPGFGAFLLGAGLHLSLYQEMANVDPSNTASTGGFRSPLESSYGLPDTGTIAKTADMYAKFADKIWPQLLADRKGMIHQKERVLCAFGDTTGSSCRNYAWFRDDLSPGNEYLPGGFPTKGNKVNKIVIAQGDKKGNNPGRDKLIAAYKAYVAQKAKELTDSMSDPAAIAASWRDLVKTPIKVA